MTSVTLNIHPNGTVDVAASNPPPIAITPEPITIAPHDWSPSNRRGMHFVALAEAIRDWTPGQIHELADRICDAPNRKAPDMTGYLVPPACDSWERGIAMIALRDALQVEHRQVKRWASYVRAVGLRAIATEAGRQ